jgi:hypothetical protein
MTPADELQRRLDPAERIVGVGRGEALLELRVLEGLDPRLGLSSPSAHAPA